MRWLKPFHLTDVERKGLTVLLFIGLALVGFRIVLIFWPANHAIAPSTLAAEIAQWKHEQRMALRVRRAFNPNTVPDSVVRKFKLPAYAAENWLKFRAKGRKFFKQEDVLAIYGMDTLWYEVNKDSILITGNEKPEAQKINQTIHRHPFDPNTASVEELKGLGIPAHIAERMVRYREKGGRFKSPEDLKRIYGFPDDLFADLFPYITISQLTQAPAKQPDQKTIARLDLNRCDSLQLIEVPGIGPVFAHRILKRRKELGGFYAPEQLIEVYGFTAEKLNAVASSISIDASAIKKLSLNKATFKELNAHPYLSYEQTKVLVRYRESVGPIKNISHLVQLEHFTAQDVERLRHYITVD